MIIYILNLSYLHSILSLSSQHFYERHTLRSSERVYKSLSSIVIEFHGEEKRPSYPTKIESAPAETVFDEKGSTRTVKNFTNEVVMLRASFRVKFAFNYETVSQRAHSAP